MFFTYTNDQIVDSIAYPDTNQDYDDSEEDICAPLDDYGYVLRDIDMFYGFFHR